MRFLTYLLDVICFVVGPAWLLGSIFDFHYMEVSGDNSIAVGYVYFDEARHGVAIGAALIAFGILRRNWAQKSG